MAKRCPKRCLRERAKNCKFGVSRTTGKCLKRRRAKSRRGGVSDSVRAAMRLANSRVYG